MAVTKIHPIKTTLNLSIDYICDASKTDEQILISSYKCGYQTAAFQFAHTKELMNSSAKNLARHLIQSFMPGEVSAETAHKIGKELCAKHLNGKYEYVLTTHVDKGHIHNHIIFNNVSIVDGKSYISNKKSYHEIRSISDQLCNDNHLSIATETVNSKIRYKTKGKSYKEYQEHRQGNSYKSKLQYAIDSAIRKAKDWDDFLRIIQEYGYEIKHGKHIAFKLIGQEGFTRSKTIGDDYTEDLIKNRINIKRKTLKNNSLKRSRSSNEVIDISSNDLAMQSAGFTRWLKLQNLKNMARLWNNITDNNITDINTFYEYINQLHDELGKTQNEIKKIESEIYTITEIIKHINIYKKYKSTYASYKNSTDIDAYFRLHESAIILFEAAQEALGDKITPSLLASVPRQKEIANSLSLQSQSLSAKLASQKREILRINHLRNNLETYLNADPQILNEKSH